jgi:hypothetical protein
MKEMNKMKEFAVIKVLQRELNEVFSSFTSPPSRSLFLCPSLIAVDIIGVCGGAEENGCRAGRPLPQVCAMFCDRDANWVCNNENDLDDCAEERMLYAMW